MSFATFPIIHCLRSTYELLFTGGVFCIWIQDPQSLLLFGFPQSNLFPPSHLSVVQGCSFQFTGRLFKVLLSSILCFYSRSIGRFSHGPKRCSIRLLRFVGGFNFRQRLRFAFMDLARFAAAIHSPLAIYFVTLGRSLQPRSDPSRL